MIDPGMEYYRATTDGESEAIAARSRQELMRKQKHG